MDKEFFILYFVASRRAPGRSTVPMQMKSSMTSIRVIYVHREREKVDFKSLEVNCLKECALALLQNMHSNIDSKHFMLIRLSKLSDRRLWFSEGVRISTEALHTYCSHTVV